MVLIEACVDDVQSARNAIAGGADRLELCDNLSDGGTTPSHGIAAELFNTADVPVFPIVRIRGGDFCYDAQELRIMASDAAHFASLGAPGIVFGALTRRGDVDVDAIRQIRDAVPDIAITFHRAFDICRDPIATIDILIELGVTRLLTSGQQPSAWQGRELLAEVVGRAAGRIVVMAGGGISEDIVADLVRITRVTEIHVRAAMIVGNAPEWQLASAVPLRKALPGNEYDRLVTDPRRIALIKAIATA